MQDLDAQVVVELFHWLQERFEFRKLHFGLYWLIRDRGQFSLQSSNLLLKLDQLHLAFFQTPPALFLQISKVFFLSYLSLSLLGFQRLEVSIEGNKVGVGACSIGEGLPAEGLSLVRDVFVFVVVLSEHGGNSLQV